MLAEQRAFLDEAIAGIRAGRITRRTFLERAMSAGLSMSAAGALLEACGATSNKKTINLVWQSENDVSGGYQAIVDKFNLNNPDIHVTWQNGPINTDILSTMRDMLQARSTAVDILSLDIIDPPEFASKGWIAPITSSQWPEEQRANYLPAPLKGCTYDNQLWAAPFRTDVGLLYYRKDIIASPPESWEELTSMALKNKAKIKYGYVWQGGQQEALVCNFQEVLTGYGGSIVDVNDPTTVTLQSPEAVQALSEMVSWIGTISPIIVTNFLEETTRQAWQRGDALFMRNWPYAYISGNTEAGSRVAGKFDIHAIPYGGRNRLGHSTIGGWQLAINAFITPERQHAAWKFIQYMLGPEAQKIGALTSSWAVTLMSIYDDPEVLRKVPLFRKLKPILQASLPRPVTPNYPQVTSAIQLYIHETLLRKKQPRDAIDQLASALKQLLRKQ